MQTKILKSFFRIETIVSFTMSFIVFSFFDYFNFINYNVSNFKLPYIIATLFLIWSLIEIIIKNNINYLFLLYFLSIPLQHWIGHKGFLVLFIVNITINYHLIFWIIFFLKSIYDKKNKKFIIKHVDAKFYFGFFILLFTSIFSILYSKNIIFAMNGVIYGIIVPFLIFLSLVNVIEYKTQIEDIYRSFNFTFLLYNIFTLIVSLSSFLLPGMKKRVIGVFTNPNNVMYAQIIVIGISLYFLHYKKEKKYLFHLLISIMIVISTGTRSAVVLIILFSLIYGKRYFKNLKVFILVNLIVIITTMILLFYWEYIFNNISLFNRFTKKGFESGRFLAWRKTIDFMINENLYFRGIGIGNYNLFNISSLIHAHNSFLQLTINIGLLSSLIYHFLIISQIKFLNVVKKNNLFYNLPRIIILTIIIYLNISSFVPLVVRPDVNLLDISVRSIYLWVFLTITYLVNKKQLI